MRRVVGFNVTASASERYCCKMKSEERLGSIYSNKMNKLTLDAGKNIKLLHIGKVLSIDGYPDTPTLPMSQQRVISNVGGTIHILTMVDWMYCIYCEM